MKNYEKLFVTSSPNESVIFGFVAAASDKHGGRHRHWANWIHVEDYDEQNIILVCTDGKRLHSSLFSNKFGIDHGDYEIISKTKAKVTMAKIMEDKHKQEYPNWKKLIPENAPKICDYAGDNNHVEINKLIRALPKESGVNPRYLEPLNGFGFDVYHEGEMKVIMFKNDTQTALIMPINMENDYA